MTADWILAPEELVRIPSIHDRHGRTLCRVIVGKRSPGQQRSLQRLEEPGSSTHEECGIEIRQWLTGWHRRFTPGGATQRCMRRDARRSHARDALNLVDEIAG